MSELGFVNCRVKTVRTSVSFAENISDITNSKEAVQHYLSHTSSRLVRRSGRVRVIFAYIAMSVLKLWY